MTIDCREEILVNNPWAGTPFDNGAVIGEKYTVNVHSSGDTKWALINGKDIMFNKSDFMSIEDWNKMKNRNDIIDSL